MRAAGLAALLLVGVLAYLTFDVLLRTGPDVLNLLSLLVLAVLGLGIFGALRPPGR
jgi:hypothetical protein